MWEVNNMAENEKHSIQAMGDAIADLPEEKKQFFLGFAEGVAAMAEQTRTRVPESSHI